MQHTHVLSKTASDTALSALVKLLEESRNSEWSVNFLIAIKTAAPRRRRERELTAVDFAHMEAVFKIREIYRKRKGTLSYAEIARYQFNHHYKDRLTANGIVQVSVRTLADHAKKKTWPPSRWRTAYNQRK